MYYEHACERALVRRVCEYVCMSVCRYVRACVRVCFNSYTHAQNNVNWTQPLSFWHDSRWFEPAFSWLKVRPSRIELYFI